MVEKFSGCLQFNYYKGTRNFKPFVMQQYQKRRENCITHVSARAIKSIIGWVGVGKKICGWKEGVQC